MTQQLTVPNPEKVSGLSSMSYEAFLDWSAAHSPHAEWVDGEIFLMPAVTNEHAWIVSFLNSILSGFAEEKKAGRVIGDPYQMWLANVRRGRQPDLMFVGTSRVDKIGRLFLDGPAHIAIEVISDSSRRIDRVDKFNEYEEAGVGEYWLIDAEQKIAEFYQLNDSGKFELVVIGDDCRYASREIPGLWIDVRWIWDRPSQLDVFRMWKLI